VALFTAIEEFGNEPLWSRFLATLSGALLLWTLYGLYHLTYYLIFVVPWTKIPWEVFGHVAAVAVIALLTTTAVLYRSPEVALIAAGAISAHLFIIITLYV